MVFEAFWQAGAGSGYSLVRHACGNVGFNFLIKQPKGGRPRERGIPRMGFLGGLVEGLISILGVFYREGPVGFWGYR